MTKLLVLAGIGLLWTVPIAAHHSFAAEFDEKQPIELKGTLTQLDWLNPHGWLHICLLYTSPSPRDGLLSRMPSSA